MIDYHFRHFTLTVKPGGARLYNWATMRPEHLSPVIMAILTPLVQAKGDVVDQEDLISNAMGARRAAAGRGRVGRPTVRAGHGRQAGSLEGLRQAASRLRKVLGSRSVKAVVGRGYRMNITVREGAR